MGTDSRAAGALLARASTLHLQTGNLLNWGRLRKKCPSTHSEEVSRMGAEPRGLRVSQWRQAGHAGARPRPGGYPRRNRGELGAIPAWQVQLPGEGRLGLSQ